MDRKEKSFEFALTTTKQVVALSTGILALTITFLNDVVSGVGGATRKILLIAWLLFLISVVSGVFTMMALTGNLDPSSNEEDLSIYEGNIQIYSLIQMTSFLFGMLLTVIFAIIVL